MELPGVLKEMVIGAGQGMIELCPDEYDMTNIASLLEETLADCEALALDSVGHIATGSSLED